MSKKRQIESSASSLTATESKRPVKPTPMTFDEVATIIQSGDGEKLQEIIKKGRVSDIP